MTVAALIAVLRTTIDDLPGDKSVFKENLARSLAGNQVTGSNQSFQANNKRITAATLSVLADGAVATVVETAAGLLRGRFSISSAAPSTSCFATYDFQFFTDDELTTFLNKAGSFVGIEDITTVPVGLQDALVFKAGSDACFSLAARTGMFYDSSAGGKSASKGDLAKKYRDLAKDLFERAVAERDAFNTNKGGNLRPAYGKTTTGQKPYTPRR